MGGALLNRTRRLLGLAKSSSAYRNWDDPRTFSDFNPTASGWIAAPDSAHPDWKDDLESLFKLVDSRLAERRSAVAGPAEGQIERRHAGLESLPTVAPPEVVQAITPPEPPNSWVGFGLEEEAPIAVAQPAAIEQLAAQVMVQVRAAVLGDEFTAAVRAAAREAVEEALRERLAAEVRAGVEGALREAAAAWDNESRMAPSTILAIRVRQRRSRRSA
jgi:hypothetical protein